MTVYKSRFGELLRESRENAQQTPDVVAILLGISAEDYLAMEAGRYFPDPDTLKRLCMMMEWNYYDAQRLIRNEQLSSSHALALTSAQRESSTQALQSLPLDPNGGAGSGRADSLGARLKDVRLLTGQSMEIIAALLSIGVEEYQRLEDGEAPSDELLRRIGVTYNWNYYDLISILRSQQAHKLQPRRMGSPFPGATVRPEKLRALVRELEAAFPALPDAEQDMVLAQLDLIRATAQRHHKSAPTPQTQAHEEAHVRRLSNIAPALPGLSDRKIFRS
jgi:transcriptional regulator with XRE-family HTH domain